MNPDEISELIESDFDDIYDDSDEDPTWGIDGQEIHNYSGKYLLNTKTQNSHFIIV